MKSSLRKSAKLTLQNLSKDRRQLAALALKEQRLPLGYILSFVSLPYEISLEWLNCRLAAEGRLLLPRMEGDILTAYHVEDLSHLLPNSLKILEPDPTRCSTAPHIDAILVPALAFDQHLHRLGHGKGYYDRLLARYPSIPHIGVGFKEQLTTLLPLEPHDKALSTLLLF